MDSIQRLTLIEMLPDRSADGHVMARFRCTCGAEVSARASRVKNGYTRSCGCLSRDLKPARRHGGHGSPTYRSWQAALRRCHNPDDKDFPRWGGKGIAVCPEWRAGFDAFLRDMGPRPTGTTLDRIDPTQGYQPGNCRWATPLEQARNRSDLVVVDTPDGRMALVDYAARIGISKGAAHLRLKRGKLEGAIRV